MNTPDYIVRMEQEYAQTHERYVKLMDYRRSLEEENQQPTPGAIESSFSTAPTYYAQRPEYDLLCNQSYAMADYLRALGARIQWCKAKEGCLNALDR